MSYTKWIAGGLGWAFGGPIGGLIGFALGSMIDGAQIRTIGGGQGRPGVPPGAGTTRMGDLALSLVVLSAAVMKADGKVTRNELDLVRRFFIQQFGERHAGELMLALREVLKQEIPLMQVCEQVRRNMSHPVRLQLMHYLIAVAHADGVVHKGELRLLESIATAMGISRKDLGSMSAMFRAPDTQSAYQILEVDPKASNEEVKSAYRRMAKKYHPDKVGHLSEEVQRSASERFRKVQEAYERIEKERGNL